MNFSRSLDVVAKPDVLVVGAGCAGTVAAIAAARQGADTMVVERSGFAGGYITNVVGASLDGFVDLRSGLPVVGGVVFDLARQAAVTEGAAITDWAQTRFRFNGEVGQMREVMDRAYVRFDIERFKLVADRLMSEAGVRILYHTVIADALTEGDRVDTVVLANKAGLTAVKPKTIVDASGDADVAAFAGAPIEVNETSQPMSLHFRVGHLQPTLTMREACGRVLAQAHADGRLPLYGGPWMAKFAADDLYFNAIRIRGNPIDPQDLSQAEIRGREDARLMFDLFKEHIPEFRDAYLVGTGPVVGVRESRRIRGETTLRLADIKTERECPDVVCLGGWWLDRHPSGKSGYHPHHIVRPYDIAYGTLVPQTLSNVWVAGRCHAAESAALASSRVTVTCMGMGQAAGTAAAMAARSGKGAQDLDVAALQGVLLDEGAIILERAQQVRRVGDAAGAVSLPSASQ